MEEQSRACAVERGGEDGGTEQSMCSGERWGRWRNGAEHAQWREAELETRLDMVRGEREG